MFFIFNKFTSNYKILIIFVLKCYKYLMKTFSLVIKYYDLILGNPELYSANAATRNSAVCLSIVMLLRLYGFI